MRVIHCPCSVGGNAWALSQAERQIGIQSHVMVTETSIYSRYFDSQLILEGSALKKKSIIYRFYQDVMEHYDIFHFNFGRTLVSSRIPFLDMVDLPYLKSKGKGIAVTYQGSDARQTDYCFSHHEITCFTKDDVLKSKKRDHLRKRRIEKFDRYADLIYTTNPDLLSVLPNKAKFRPYTKIDLNVWSQDFSDYAKDELVIAHAPSNRKVKGTDYIRNAIGSLQAEGYPVRLLLIEKVPNDEVMDFYRQADLLIDQLLIGWYGGVSVEFMALGKPVIVYLRESDLIRLPEEMRSELPFIRATPENIKEVIKQCIEDRTMLRERAHASRLFVEKWHDPVEVAKDIKKDYERIVTNQRHMV